MTMLSSTESAILNVNRIESGIANANPTACVILIGIQNVTVRGSLNETRSQMETSNGNETSTRSRISTGTMNVKPILFPSASVRSIGMANGIEC